MKPIDLEKLEKPEIIKLFKEKLVGHAVTEAENEKLKSLLKDANYIISSLDERYSYSAKFSSKIDKFLEDEIMIENID